MDSDKKEQKLTFNPETGLCVKQTVVYIIFSAVFIDTISTSISNPVMPFYAKSFDVSKEAIGFMYAASTLAAFLGTPLLGKMNDLYGRQPVLLLACIGAGIAGLGQAASESFPLLFVSRVFSGIWTAVASVANVYISDVCSPEVLPEYMAMLAAVPNFSRTMGPGLGGGLSELGMRVPIAADALMNIFLALLVYVYVPESPVWLRKKDKIRQRREQGEGEEDFRPTRSQSVESMTVPWVAYSIGLAQALNGIQVGITNSMLALSLEAKFNWDALDVGYVGVLQALVTLAAGIWVTRRAVRRIGARDTALLGTFIIACGMVMMGSFSDPVFFLIGNSVRAFGMGLRQGSIGTLEAQVTNVMNRATVFSRIQMFNQAGQFLGPILGGYIATFDAKRWLWWFSSSTTFMSTLLLFFVEAPGAKKTEVPLLEGYTSGIGTGELKDEVGSDADYAALAQHIGGLLTKRHYQWVSNREHIYEMFDKLLPELSTDGEQHVKDLKVVLFHAESINAALTG